MLAGELREIGGGAVAVGAVARGAGARFLLAGVWSGLPALPRQPQRARRQQMTSFLIRGVLSRYRAADLAGSRGVERREIGHVLVAQARGDRAHRRMACARPTCTPSARSRCTRRAARRASARCTPTETRSCSRECCGSRCTSTSFCVPASALPAASAAARQRPRQARARNSARPEHDRSFHVVTLVAEVGAKNDARLYRKRLARRVAPRHADP